MIYCYFDVNNDGGSDVVISNSFTASTEAKVTGFNTTDASVAPGTLIGPGPKYHFFGTDIDRTMPGFQLDAVIGDNQLLPFSFNSVATLVYGWLDLSIQDPNLPGAGVIAPYDVTLNGYTFDDSGASIRAGATATDVPEPSSLLLLAAGFAGLSALRRKSRASAFTA